jgi:hypothetical protein
LTKVRAASTLTVANSSFLIGKTLTLTSHPYNRSLGIRQIEVASECSKSTVLVALAAL